MVAILQKVHDKKKQAWWKTKKRFKIITDKYRDRHKRFSLRFNLIAGIYNYELVR